MKKIKIIICVILINFLVSCKLPINSKEYKSIPISKDKINIKDTNVEKNIIKYKYCDNVILYVIPTGFKNKNVDYVVNKALYEYNEINNKNYNYMSNVKISRYVYHFPPFFYRICINIEGNGGFDEKNI